jgi:pheromone shutdown protein TraB
VERRIAETSRRRCNIIYVACGLAMFACIALIAVFWDFPSASPIRHQVLVLERGAILAFSISWFLMGSEHLKRVVGLGWRKGSVRLIETARR